MSSDCPRWSVVDCFRPRGRPTVCVTSRGPAVGDADGVIVVSRPILDRQTLTPTGEDQLLVFPSPEACLSEAIPSDRAVRELLDLPFEEVCAYVTELGRRLQPGDDTVGQAMETAARTSPLGGRAMRVFAAQLAGLLDPDALGEAVDRELALGASRADPSSTAGSISSGQAPWRFCPDVGSDLRRIHVRCRPTAPGDPDPAASHHGREQPDRVGGIDALGDRDQGSDGDQTPRRFAVRHVAARGGHGGCGWRPPPDTPHEPAVLAWGRCAGRRRPPVGWRVRSMDRVGLRLDDRGHRPSCRRHQDRVHGAEDRRQPHRS